MTDQGLILDSITQKSGSTSWSEIDFGHFCYNWTVRVLSLQCWAVWGISSVWEISSIGSPKPKPKPNPSPHPHPKPNPNPKPNPKPNPHHTPKPKPKPVWGISSVSSPNPNPKSKSNSVWVMSSGGVL